MRILHEILRGKPESQWHTDEGKTTRDTNVEPTIIAEAY